MLRRRARTEPAEMMKALRARHPGLREALLADARVTAAYRGERHEFRSRADAALQVLRLMWVADAFLAQVSIGDPVVMAPGVYIVHGQVVIDGVVDIASGVVIAPWVTVGLRAGIVRGPNIEAGVSIGTGAKVIGPITVGAGAQVGANAVVVRDVAAGATVVGAPARLYHPALR